MLQDVTALIFTKSDPFYAYFSFISCPSWLLSCNGLLTVPYSVVGLGRVVSFDTPSHCHLYNFYKPSEQMVICSFSDKKTFGVSTAYHYGPWQQIGSWGIRHDVVVLCIFLFSSALVIFYGYMASCCNYDWLISRKSHVWTVNINLHGFFVFASFRTWVCFQYYYMTNSYRPGIKKFDWFKAGL